jgi:hypothetical protein
LTGARRRVAHRRRLGGVLKLLFVGGFGHQPNGDAIVWFAAEVAPLLRGRGVVFHLDTGARRRRCAIWPGRICRCWAGWTIWCSMRCMTRPMW